MAHGGKIEVSKKLVSKTFQKEKSGRVEYEKKSIQNKNHLHLRKCIALNIVEFGGFFF